MARRSTGSLSGAIEGSSQMVSLPRTSQWCDFYGTWTCIESVYVVTHLSYSVVPPHPMHSSSIAALTVAVLTAPLFAQQVQPIGLIHPTAQPLGSVASYGVPNLNRALLATEDINRAANGQPARFAVPNPVTISPATHGTWEQLDESWSLWRLKIKSPGAEHVNLGFQSFFMPAGARMQLYSTNYRNILRPFDSNDHQPTGQFWTPVVLGSEVVCEVYVRTAMTNQIKLDMIHIGSGYRFFGAGPTALTNNDGSGSCNVDVTCPQGSGWEGEISASAAISTGGSIFCSGSMINNTANDGRNFFLTAFHCGVSSSQAPSLVCYWNYDAVSCGSNTAPLSQFTIGATYRSGFSTSDFTLLELNSTPNSSWGVTYAGWNRGTGNASSAVAIHHPSGDSKKISFENQATQTTGYGSSNQNSNANHVRVVDWDVGTTEPGSSGSPLFDQNHRIIGQLHGGGAACGNNSSDWYGRFVTSWTGGGSNSSRLSNWLDPLNTGQLTLDTSGAGNSAIITSVGNGCGGTAITCDEAFYETPGFDLANSSFTLDYDGTAYSLVAGQGSWIPPFGGVLSLGDDSEVTQSLPFSLPYPGGSTNSLAVCSNGFISTVSNGTAWTPDAADFLADATRWCPMWHDLSPNQNGSGDVHFNVNASRAVVTWNGVEYYSSNSTATFQIQFWANGDVHCIYQSVASGGNDYLVGFSMGGVTADPGSMDISTSLNGSVQVCNSTAGTQNVALNSSTRPITGTTVSLVTSNLPAGAAGGLSILSLTPIAGGIDLTFLGMPGCRVYQQLTVVDSFGIIAGSGFRFLPIPNAPSLIGTKVFNQSVVLALNINSANMVTSNGLELTIGDV